MINNFFLMNGYGIYVWSAFSFSCLSFASLFFIIKSQLDKETNKFSQKFYKLYETLKRVNFQMDLINEINYFAIDRWDILLKNGKLLKLPTERLESSVEKFISIYNKDNFKNFKIFDFRINGQLILE